MYQKQYKKWIKMQENTLPTEEPQTQYEEEIHTDEDTLVQDWMNDYQSQQESIQYNLKRLRLPQSNRPDK